jgi:hypothetical protein
MQQERFELLYEQQYEHGITAHGPASGNRVGLTPSFLVGAMRTPPGVGREVTTSHRELSALLESMRDNVWGKLVCTKSRSATTSTSRSQALRREQPSATWVTRFCLLMVRRPSSARRHTILREPHAMSNRWRTACGGPLVLNL